MAIRYKVVSKDTRCSIIVGSNSSYMLRYNQNTTVRALSKTLGIMVFKRRYQAEIFANLITFDFLRIPIILRVKVFERGKCPKYVSRWTANKSDLVQFYNRHYIDKKYLKENSGWFDLRIPPKGTLCYDMVKVID